MRLILFVVSTAFLMKVATFITLVSRNQKSRHLAHKGRQRPPLEEDCLELERDGEHSDDDVGKGEVGDVHVRHCAGSSEYDNVDDKTVAEDSNEGSEDIEADEEDGEAQGKLKQRIAITKSDALLLKYCEFTLGN